MTSNDRQQLAVHFEKGFRELALVDIHRANQCDVGMGTFTLCAAFIDALSLAYSAKIPPKDDGKKWAVFMEKYFGKAYEPVWDSYLTLRCRLLHNYSAEGLGFTSSTPKHEYDRHLKVEDGLRMLHRESFVADVQIAFDTFYTDVRTNDVLGERVLRHLNKIPPLGVRFLAPTPNQYFTTSLSAAPSLSAIPALPPPEPNRAARRAKNS